MARKPKKSLCICLQQWLLGNTTDHSSHEPKDENCCDSDGDHPSCLYGRPRMVERKVWMDQENEDPPDCATLPIRLLKKSRYKELEAEWLADHRDSSEKMGLD